MSAISHAAKHFKDVHYGGNWTSSNLKETLNGVTWQQATTQVYDLNTIASLTYHIHYYVHAVIAVLQGGALDASDKLSFDHPPISSQADWDNLLTQVFADADTFAILLQQLPEHKLWENFTDEKYGNYYRNIHGIIEHTHYHLGQIALLKKIIWQQDKHV